MGVSFRFPNAQPEVEAEENFGFVVSWGCRGDHELLSQLWAKTQNILKRVTNRALTRRFSIWYYYSLSFAVGLTTQGKSLRKIKGISGFNTRLSRVHSCHYLHKFLYPLIWLIRIYSKAFNSNWLCLCYFSLPWALYTNEHIHTRI